MIKKIIITFLFFCLIAYCGKKGDPKYKDPKQNAEVIIILTNKV
tara:strand:- start:131 stop:262 length:132 start_codon:yes stop_codon:yes gene_type:complete